MCPYVVCKLVVSFLFLFCRVGYILNVTREIDNFFPGTFHYHNIRFVHVHFVLQMYRDRDVAS